MFLLKHSLLKSIYLHIFLITVVILLRFSYMARLANYIQTPDMYYDYVIVGGGTAGCVLATRLSEGTKCKVLLIEAGHEFGLFSKLPMASILLQGGSSDWAYKTVPQEYSSFGLHNQSQAIPRGKGLGGSAGINYMQQAIGQSEDFDRWASMGASIWDYENLQTYLQETFVDNQEPENELMNIFRKSVEDLGKPDLTFIHPKAAIKNAHRFSVIDSHLSRTTNFKNLHVLLDATVFKINFFEKHAISVSVLLNNDEIHIIHSNRDIILSAGAIETPKLLMLSGIGPKIELLNHNIEPVHISEGVGANLHDHLNMPVYVSIEAPLSVTVDKLLSLRSVWDYFWNSEGILSMTAVLGSVLTGKQSILTLFAMGSVDEALLREIANYRVEIFRSLFPYYADKSKEGFVFLSSCLQPKSRGVVGLRDDNFKTPPKIDPNYLSEEVDVACMLKGIHTAVSLLETTSFKNIGAKVVWPRFDECNTFFHETDLRDDYLECLLRMVALTGHHVGGTCSMAGENRVVDSKLRLIGVKGLRIIDASILPTPVSSYPNNVIIAIAEKAGDIIKLEYLSK